jgi:hypothetical protein
MAPKARKSAARKPVWAASSPKTGPSLSPKRCKQLQVQPATTLRGGGNQGNQVAPSSGSAVRRSSRLSERDNPDSERAEEKPDPFPSPLAKGSPRKKRLSGLKLKLRFNLDKDPAEAGEKVVQTEDKEPGSGTPTPLRVKLYTQNSPPQFPGGNTSEAPSTPVRSLKKTVSETTTPRKSSLVQAGSPPRLSNTPVRFASPVVTEEFIFNSQVDQRVEEYHQILERSSLESGSTARSLSTVISPSPKVKSEPSTPILNRSPTPAPESSTRSTPSSQPARRKKIKKKSKDTSNFYFCCIIS